MRDLGYLLSGTGVECSYDHIHESYIEIPRKIEQPLINKFVIVRTQFGWHLLLTSMFAAQLRMGLESVDD